MARRIDASAPKPTIGPRHAPVATSSGSSVSAGASRDSTSVSSSEPESVVSRSYDYGPESGKARKTIGALEIGLEAVETWLTPGEYTNRNSKGGKKGIRQLRDSMPEERAIKPQGLYLSEHGWRSETVTNPNSPDGRFDPYAFMPTLAFHAKEDSFPVLPDFDQNGALKDLSSYKHGVIGGRQAMKGSFHATKKGEYTVLTYSLYYVDNKAGKYHEKDSSTFAVYLKPGSDGKLEPEYLYTSWHYGANLSKWKDLKKDSNGRPVIEVERGSHALRPMGRSESLPSKGVLVDGSGQIKLNGKSLPNRMSWVSPQENVVNADHVNPMLPESRLLLDTYYKKYPERTDPIHPILFEKHGMNSWLDDARVGAASAAKKVKSGAKQVGSGIKSVGRDVGSLGRDLKSRAEGWFS